MALSKNLGVSQLLVIISVKRSAKIANDEQLNIVKD
jgi:hypothetical protein